MPLTRSKEVSMTPSMPDEIAALVRRLPPAQQREALAYVTTLERAVQPPTLTAFVGSIPPADLAAMTAAIEADCERIDGADW